MFTFADIKTVEDHYQKSVSIHSSVGRGATSKIPLFSIKFRLGCYQCVFCYCFFLGGFPYYFVYRALTKTTHTVLQVKSDSDIMLCIQSNQGLIMDRINKKVIYRLVLAQVKCTSIVLLNNCKQNITTL